MTQPGVSTLSFYTQIRNDRYLEGIAYYTNGYRLEACATLPIASTLRSRNGAGLLVYVGAGFSPILWDLPRFQSRGF
jgi:hypothetical protein